MKKYNLKEADNTTQPQKTTLGIRAGLSLTSFLVICYESN